MKRFATVASALSALFLIGCGSLTSDRVESICACESCGESLLEQKEIEVNGEYDIAETYDCIELLEPYWECQLDKHECSAQNYQDDDDECGNEKDEYDQCLTAKSSRGPGPYDAPGDE